MNLSKRMEAVAAMVTRGYVLADVGCDHGHVPIVMVQRGQIPRGIAMDLRPGPLAHAAENIARCGLTEQIETRLGDGVSKLAVGEADAIIIAGMGGELVQHIMTEGRRVCRSAKELILQPQSELAQVRRFLKAEGYQITRENMIEEDGKFYPMMRVEWGAGDLPSHGIPEELAEAYGGFLLRERNPTLQRFLEKEKEHLRQIKNQLAQQEQTPKIKKRLKEVEDLQTGNARAIAYYK